MGQVSAVESDRVEQSGSQAHIAATESVSLWVGDEKLTAFVELESAMWCALVFRESNNFCFAFLLGFALGHEFLHQVVHDVGDGPAGLISQFPELHERGLIERVQWKAVERERRDVPRRWFHALRCATFSASARKF